MLAAEMEPAVASDPASLIRLVAYGKAGFGAIDPAALPYCQPDFRDLAAGEAARPLPLLAVVRWVGHEGSPTLPKHLARAYLRHLHAVFATHVRPDLLAAEEARSLDALAAHPPGEVALLPLPKSLDDRAAIAPLSRDQVLTHFPVELR
jgi:hypothetical protein